MAVKCKRDPAILFFLEQLEVHMKSRRVITVAILIVSAALVFSAGMLIVTQRMRRNRRV